VIFQLNCMEREVEVMCEIRPLSDTVRCDPEAVTVHLITLTAMVFVLQLI